MIFPTHINGIPCQCKVVQYEPYIPPPMWGERLDPPDEEYFEFEILDRKGYPARWLADKASPEDAIRFRDEYLQKFVEEVYR